MPRIGLVKVETVTEAPDYASALANARVRSGAWIEDADGSRRLDLVNADGTVLLGWNDPEVEIAAADPAPSGLNARVASRLAALTPNAEAVAFEVSLAASMSGVLLAARAVTGRDGAYFCEEAVSAASDLQPLTEAVEARGSEMAAIIIRPLDASTTFLRGARRLADRVGAMLIFEESRTALRVHRGGAQALSGVKADAVIYGASLANGRALSAVVGRVELLSVFERQGPVPGADAFAAADVVLSRVARDDVAQALQINGAEIIAELELKLIRSGAGQFVGIHGDPSWSVLAGDEAFETALSQALAREGVFSLGAHILSAAFGTRETAQLLAAYDRALPRVLEQFRWTGRRAG